MVIILQYSQSTAWNKLRGIWLLWLGVMRAVCVCITVWRSVIKSTHWSECWSASLSTAGHNQLGENPWCMHIRRILLLLDWFPRLRRSTNGNFPSYPVGYAGCDSRFFWKLSSVWSDSPPWPREPASRRRSNILWQADIPNTFLSALISCQILPLCPVEIYYNCSSTINYWVLMLQSLNLRWWGPTLLYTRLIFL